MFLPRACVQMLHCICITSRRDWRLVSRRRLDLPGTNVARAFQGAAPKAATPFEPTCWILYICLHWHLRDYNCFQRDHHSRLTGGSLGVQNSPYKKPFRSIHGQWQIHTMVLLVMGSRIAVTTAALNAVKFPSGLISWKGPFPDLRSVTQLVLMPTIPTWV
jgi:hypothetical protein